MFNKNKFRGCKNDEIKGTRSEKECWECEKGGHFWSECPASRKNKE